MATQTDTNAHSKTEINNFFTSTIVGKGKEVVLGQVLKDRIVKSNQFVSADAMQARAWLSEPAYKHLKKALMKSQRITGISFRRHFVNHFSYAGRSSILMFLFGFLVCAVCGLVLAYAW